jgi:tetratricopeptide (TPR) repeat protein
MTLLADAVRASARVSGAKGVDAIRMRLDLGRAYFDEGRFEDAEPVIDAAIVELRQRPDYHLLLARTLIVRARLSLARGQVDAARSTAEEATALLARTAEGRLPSIVQSHSAAIEAYTVGGLLGEARSTLERAKSVPEAAGLRFPVNQMMRDVVAAELLLGRGESGAATDQLRAIVERIESDDETKYHTNLLSRAFLGLGRSQLVHGELAAARTSLQRAVELRRQLGPPDSPWLAEAKVALADCLITQGEHQEASRLLAEAEQAFAKHLPLGRQFLYPLEKVKQRL